MFLDLSWRNIASCLRAPNYRFAKVFGNNCCRPSRTEVTSWLEHPILKLPATRTTISFWSVPTPQAQLFNHWQSEAFPEILEENKNHHDARICRPCRAASNKVAIFEPFLPETA